VQHSDFGSYRNTQQSPVPDRPNFRLDYTIAWEAGAAAAARAAGADGGPQACAAGDLVAVPRFGRRRASRRERLGLCAGQELQTQLGHAGRQPHDSGRWETKLVRSPGRCRRPGRAEFYFKTPDDLGGAHNLWVEADETRKEGTFWIAPTALPLDVARGPVGTTFRIHLKGVGWSETANIYTVVYDNATSGYACAFNSQGDIEIVMQATGTPGWHFIDLYPAIYKGSERRPNNYRLPQLTAVDDHPGEDLPIFRFAFEIVSQSHAPKR
jgi:hypothetical protein